MMAEAENRDEAVDIGPEAAQILTLLSGSFASGFDVAAASVAINRREERWLDARGVDDVAVRAALETRTARAHAHADKLLTTLARASATPVPDKGAIVLNGRITDVGAEREGVEVVALDRQGHALGQATTGVSGSFSIRLDSDSEQVVLMVTDPNGKRLAVDEQVIDVKRGGVAFREFDIASKGRPRREKADLGDRVAMPNLSGMNVEEAGGLLREMGFRDVEVTLDPQRNAEGVVVKTDPQPGNLVEPSRPIELTVGKDPDARFDRNLVASVVKVETGEAVPDAAVDRMFEALSGAGATGFDRLKSAARRDDRSFADLTGLPAGQAAKARKSLLKTMTGLGTIRDRNG